MQPLDGGMGAVVVVVGVVAVLRRDKKETNEPTDGRISSLVGALIEQRRPEKVAQP